MVVCRWRCELSAFALTHFSGSVNVCVNMDVLCVHDSVRRKVEAKCGCGPLALVQGADTSYDLSDRGHCFFTPLFLLLFLFSSMYSSLYTLQIPS